MLRLWEWPLLVLALFLFLAQLLIASPQKSAAFDEQYHLTAGYSYLRTGDPRLATTHPPLMGLIASLDSDPWTSLESGSRPSSAWIAAGVIPGEGS